VNIDTILRLFSLIVLGLILVIIIALGLIERERKRTVFSFDPWALGKNIFVGWIILVLVLGVTTGFFFISPTDGWVEIVTEALAVSLILTVVEVIGVGVYFRWRKNKL
jgi:hypothetical protein